MIVYDKLIRILLQCIYIYAILDYVFQYLTRYIPFFSTFINTSIISMKFFLSVLYVPLNQTKFLCFYPPFYYRSCTQKLTAP